MSDNPCEWWDDYLDDSLSAGQQSVFDSHLETCDQCREDLQLQERLDAALLSYSKALCPARVFIPSSPPAPLFGARQRMFAVAAVAASLLIIALAAQHWSTKPSPRTMHQAVTQIDPPPVALPLDPASELPTASRTMPHLRTIHAPDHMVVIEPPTDDGLTVVMLYPQLNPLKENRNAD